MEAERILVIILSLTLTVMLLIGIIIMVKVLILINRVKKISDNVENLTDKAVSVSELVKAAASSMAVSKIFANIVRSSRRYSKKTNKKGDEDE